MLVAKTGYDPQLRLEAFYTGGSPARITRDGKRLVCPCADEVKASWRGLEGWEQEGGGAGEREPPLRALGLALRPPSNAPRPASYYLDTPQIVDLASGMVERTLAGVSSCECA